MEKPCGMPFTALATNVNQQKNFVTESKKKFQPGGGGGGGLGRRGLWF